MRRRRERRRRCVPEPGRRRQPRHHRYHNHRCLLHSLHGGAGGKRAGHVHHCKVQILPPVFWSSCVEVRLSAPVFKFKQYTKMKTATNIYIFSLALADALVTSTLPFQSVNYLMGTWPFGDILCKMVMSIDYYNMFISIFTLTTMSIDRYIAVCHPVKALDFRTPRNAKIVNVCNWILSSAIGLPVTFLASTVTNANIVDCKLDFPSPAWYWETLMKICVFIFAFIMPILIITVCYGLMILRLKSVRMLSGSQEKDRNLRRITRMVLVVVAVFIICWTPIHVFVIISALINIPSSTLQTITWHFCIALGYTNSSLNPVLYGYLDENFKRCFREFCTPSASVLEMPNSSRTGATSRKVPRREHNGTNTSERSNQQV
ncbi:mu-type opioid receptor isoform X1 [Poecilia reticulata]|nr:PREDICTED: delta-type opioid receptor-like isoform X1 [Poecilia reticulata]